MGLARDPGGARRGRLRPHRRHRRRGDPGRGRRAPARRRVRGGRPRGAAAHGRPAHRRRGAVRARAHRRGVRLPARWASSPISSRSARHSAAACPSARRSSASAWPQPSRPAITGRPTAATSSPAGRRWCSSTRLTAGGLQEHVQDVGAQFAAGLAALAAKHPVVREVRGAGLMWGLDLRVDAAPFVQAALAARCAHQPDGDDRPAPAPALRHLERGSRAGPRAVGRDPDRGRPGASLMIAEPTLHPLTVAGVVPPPLTVPAPGEALVVRLGAPEDAPAIHRLITRNLQQGHLLPRSTRRRDGPRGPLHRRHQPGGRPPGVRRTRARSARASRRCVRSSSGRARAARAWGTRWSSELRRRARAGQFRTLCAFTHDPRFFVRFGFSIVPHTWLPEKVAADCWSCPLFQKCGQYAVVDTRLGRPVIPALRPGVRVVTDGLPAGVAIEPDRRRHHGARGLPCGGRGVRDQEDRRPGLAPSSPRTAPPRPPPCSPRTRPRRRPSSCPGSTSRRADGHARAILVNSGCANACTGPEGMAVARSSADFAASAIGCRADEILVASTGVIGVQLDLDKLLDGHRPRGARAVARGARGRRARDHDHRPRAEGSRGVRDDGRGDVPRGRHREGRGHDRAAHGDDARLPHDRRRRGGAAPAARASSTPSTSRSTPSPSTAIRPPTTPCSCWPAARPGCTIDEGSYAVFVAALREVCGRLAKAIVRGGEGATKLVSITATGAASAEEARQRCRDDRQAPCSSRPPSTAPIRTGGACSPPPGAPA